LRRDRHTDDCISTVTDPEDPDIDQRQRVLDQVRQVYPKAIEGPIAKLSKRANYQLDAIDGNGIFHLDREEPNVKHQRARATVSRVKDELSLRALRCMR
jgi:hypothetical protein